MNYSSDIIVQFTVILFSLGIGIWLIVSVVEDYQETQKRKKIRRLLRDTQTLKDLEDLKSLPKSSIFLHNKPKEVRQTMERDPNQMGPRVATRIVGTYPLIKGPMKIIAEVEPQVGGGFYPWVSLLWEDEVTEPVRIASYMIEAHTEGGMILPVIEQEAAEIALVAMSAMRPILLNLSEEAIVKNN